MIPDVPYRSVVRPLTDEEGGGYLIEFPELQGCMSDGESVEEAIINGSTRCKAGSRRCAPRVTRSRSRWRGGRREDAHGHRSTNDFIRGPGSQPADAAVHSRGCGRGMA